MICNKTGLVSFQLCTLRGSILEDVITARHISNKGHPAKDVIEYVCPEINVACLKVATNPKMQEQIMRVDEHNVSCTNFSEFCAVRICWYLNETIYM